jgi:hypothetical protein
MDVDRRDAAGRLHEFSVEHQSPWFLKLRAAATPASTATTQYCTQSSPSTTSHGGTVFVSVSPANNLNQQPGILNPALEALN